MSYVDENGMTVNDLNVEDPRKACVSLPTYQAIACPFCSGVFYACSVCRGMRAVRIDPSDLPIYVPLRFEQTRPAKSVEPL